MSLTMVSRLREQARSFCRLIERRRTKSGSILVPLSLGAILAALCIMLQSADVMLVISGRVKYGSVGFAIARAAFDSLFWYIVFIIATVLLVARCRSFAQCVAVWLGASLSWGESLIAYGKLSTALGGANIQPASNRGLASHIYGHASVLQDAFMELWWIPIVIAVVVTIIWPICRSAARGCCPSCFYPFEGLVPGTKCPECGNRESNTDSRSTGLFALATAVFIILMPTICSRFIN